MDRNYTASSRNAIRPYSNRRASFSLAENVEQLNRSLGLQDEEEDLSGKRTMASTLYNNGYDEHMVKSKTGHRSDAVRKYQE